jgi:transposase
VSWELTRLSPTITSRAGRASVLVSRGNHRGRTAHPYCGTPLQSRCRPMSAKLNAKKVLRMRSRYRQGLSTREVAREFGVSHHAARHALIGNTWRHVPGAMTLRKHSDSTPRGSTVGCAVLNEELVAHIRKLYAKGASAGQLAARFGVSNRSIRDAITGRTWAHVPRAIEMRSLAEAHPKGAAASVARKLTAANVVEMRRRRQDGATLESLARRVKVTVSAVSLIVRGLSWAHVPPVSGRSGIRRPTSCRRSPPEGPGG